MVITDIVEISKTKVKVCMDDDISFALYKSELRRFAIGKDSELTKEQYDMIMNEVLLKRAKLRCMNLLQSISSQRSSDRDFILKRSLMHRSHM